MELETTDKLVVAAESPGWDRGAVFLANLPSLFFGNRKAADILRQRVGRLETYGGRLAPILDLLFRKCPNLLVLERAPSTDLLDYFRSGLGLSLPEIRVAPAGFYDAVESGALTSAHRKFLTALRGHPAEWMDGFVTDHGVETVAGLAGKQPISTMVGSSRGNNKLLLHEFLEAGGLPVFDTHRVENPAAATAVCKCLLEQGYRQAVAKAPVGASGIGMERFDLHAALAPGADLDALLPRYLFHSGCCMVQGWIDDALPGVRFVASPSAQLFLGDGDPFVYDSTEQILSHESIHEGNVAPPPCLLGSPELEAEFLRQAHMVAVWLAEQGYRGTASVDFLLIERDGGMVLYVCEVNARVTGATYPSLLAHRFHPDGAWQMRNVRPEDAPGAARLLGLLDGARLLFDGKLGFIPVNFNETPEGGVAKMQLLALGRDVAETNEMFDRLAANPELKCHYDRD